MPSFKQIVITPVDNWKTGKWNLNVTGVSSNGKSPTDAVLARAKTQIERLLASQQEPGKTSGLTGYGYVVVSEREGQNVIIVGLWMDDGRANQYFGLVGDSAPTGFAFSLYPWEMKAIEWQHDKWYISVIGHDQPTYEVYAAARHTETYS